MNTENNYQATDLGNISPNPRGDYAASASYEYLDLVNMDGGSYICLAELGTTVTGVSPEPGKTTETWQCIALPGDLTPEYIAMHDDVVNKAESVAEDTEKVTEMHENVTGMESNVQELQKQAAQSAEEAESSKDSAAGYARAADASRQAAEEAEANVNAQVTGFDSHVQEKTAEAEGAIAEARQAAVEVVHTATNTATDAAERAGRAASTAEEAKTAAAGSETNAAASASAAKTSETNAKASEESAKEAMQAAQDAAAGVAADREQITANKEGITALKKNRSSAIVQTATGTSIVAQDSADDPVRGLRVFGRTTQDGTPTPDAPVPLVSVGDGGSVEVGVYGKNLLQCHSYTSLGLSSIISDDGAVTVSGTSTNSWWNGNNENSRTPIPSGTYIFSIDKVETFRVGIKFYDINNQKHNYIIYPGRTKIICEVQEDWSIVYFFLEGIPSGVEFTATFKPMLRLTTIAGDTYEPYKSKQTLTISTPNGLPGIPVNNESLANYTDESGQMWCSDEIDLERGVYVQRVLVIEDLKSLSNFNAHTPSYGSGVTVQYGAGCTLINTYVYCTHYPYCPNNWHKTNNTMCVGGYGLSEIQISVSKDVATTGNEFKEFINNLGEPIKVLACLDTPIETPLTDAELSAYQSLHSNYPVTTVLNDAGAHMEFSYNADPKNYIAAEHAKMEAAFDAKLAEIIALLPAETQAAMIDNETTNLLNESEE